MNYSLQRLLIILGLVIIPFYEIFLRMLPFVHGVAPDSRVTKEILAVVFALSIGLLAVWHGNIKPFKNKFLLIIPVYLLFNLIMAPHVDLIINNMESGDFYFWKPFAEVLCFTFMIIAVASMEINIEEILRVMIICGTVMAGYVILQKLGLDQFYTVKPSIPWIAEMSNSEIGGSLGQKTIVASFIVMIIPLAMYFKKWWMSGLMVIACLLTHGSMVTAALVLIFVIFLFYRYMALRMLIIVLALASIMVIGFYKPIQNKIINRMDGRYEVWKNTLSDIHNGQLKDDKHKFGITGVGLGRFPFIFPNKHNSEFKQTHNDPMEFIYNCGLVGGFLLFAGIFVMISNINLDHMGFSILLSFIAIFFCSLGSFPFQLGAHQFYASILVGFLHNDSITRGKA